MTRFLMNGAVCGFGSVLSTRITEFKSDAIILWEVTPFDVGQGNDGSSYPDKKNKPTDISRVPTSPVLTATSKPSVRRIGKLNSSSPSLIVYGATHPIPEARKL